MLSSYRSVYSPSSMCGSCLTHSGRTQQSMRPRQDAGGRQHSPRRCGASRRCTPRSRPAGSAPGPPPPLALRTPPGCFPGLEKEPGQRSRVPDPPAGTPWLPCPPQGLVGGRRWGRWGGEVGGEEREVSARTQVRLWAGLRSCAGCWLHAAGWTRHITVVLLAACAQN